MKVFVALSIIASAGCAPLEEAHQNEAISIVWNQTLKSSLIAPDILWRTDCYNTGRPGVFAPAGTVDAAPDQCVASLYFPSERLAIIAPSSPFKFSTTGFPEEFVNAYDCDNGMCTPQQNSTVDKERVSAARTALQIKGL